MSSGRAVRSSCLRQLASRQERYSCPAGSVCHAAYVISCRSDSLHGCQSRRVSCRLMPPVSAQPCRVDAARGTGDHRQAADVRNVVTSSCYFRRFSQRKLFFRRGTADDVCSHSNDPTDGPLAMVGRETDARWYRLSAIHFKRLT